MTRRPHEDPVLNLIAEMRWHPRLWVWWSPFLLTMNAAVRRHPRLWAWWVPAFVALNAVLGLWFVKAYANGPLVSCQHPGDFADGNRAVCWRVFVHSQTVLEMTPPDAIFLTALVINALLIAVAILSWRLHRLG